MSDTVTPVTLQGQKIITSAVDDWFQNAKCIEESIVNQSNADYVDNYKEIFKQGALCKSLGLTDVKSFKKYTYAQTQQKAT